MAGNGFIKLHRKIQDHWIYQEKRKFSKYEAWLDILMMASYKDTNFVLGKELIDLKKGSFITSELKLMERWGWGKEKLRAFLKLLENDNMITRISDRKKTTINICNYGVYHDYDEEIRPQTDREQTTDGLLTVHNQEVKELKESKEEQISYFRSFYSDEQLVVIDQYFDVIASTRKSNKLSSSVVKNEMEYWSKFQRELVVHSLEIHIKDHKGKKEEYTRGIIRNAKPEDLVKVTKLTEYQRKKQDYERRWLLVE